MIFLIINHAECAGTKKKKGRMPWMTLINKSCLKIRFAVTVIQVLGNPRKKKGEKKYEEDKHCPRRARALGHQTKRGVFILASDEQTQSGLGFLFDGGRFESRTEERTPKIHLLPKTRTFTDGLRARQFKLLRHEIYVGGLAHSRSVAVSYHSRCLARDAENDLWHNARIKWYPLWADFWHF